MPENNKKLSPEPPKGRIHFRDLPGDLGVFQPLLTVCEVWSGDPAAEASRLLGLVNRTYRNSASYTPGVPIWIYRDDKTGEGLESFHSEANLREQITAHYGGMPPVPAKESTHQIWDAAVIFVGLPQLPELHEQTTAQIRSVLDPYFESYTIVPSQGQFRGVSEPSLAIYVTPPKSDMLAQAASELRTLLQEEGVGIFFQGKYLRVTEHAAGSIEPVA